MDSDTVALIGSLVSDGANDFCIEFAEHVGRRYWKYVDGSGSEARDALEISRKWCCGVTSPQLELIYLNPHGPKAQLPHQVLSRKPYQFVEIARILMIIGLEP